MKFSEILFVCILLLQSCSSVPIPGSNENDIIYNQLRFSIIDLVDVEQLSGKYNLVYVGTEGRFHLLIALPLDKFSFYEKAYYALNENECPIENTHYPEQSLFYNITEMENWKVLQVIDGLCVIKEASQLRFLF